MANIVQHADMWVIQMGDGLCFSLEALLVHRVAAELGGENLNGYCAVQPRIARAIYLSHPTRAQRRKDFVGPKSCCRGQRHDWMRLYSRRNSLTVFDFPLLWARAACLALLLAYNTTTAELS